MFKFELCFGAALCDAPAVQIRNSRAVQSRLNAQFEDAYTFQVDLVVLEFHGGPGWGEVPLLPRNQPLRAIGTVPAQRELVRPLHRRFREA